MNIKNSILFKEKDLRLFCILRFIFGISYSFLIPIIPLFLESLGATTIVVGTFMSLYGVGKAIAQVLFGPVSDSFGDKKLWCIALILLVLIPIGYIFTKFSLMGEIIYVFQGIFLGIAAPPTFSVLARVLDEKKRGESTGYASAVFTLGGGIGAIISGYILSLFSSFNIIFILTCIGIIISLAFLIFKIKGPEKVMEKCKCSKEPIMCRLKVIYEEVKEKKLLVKIVLLSFIALLGDFIYGSTCAMFPFYGREVLGGTTFYTSFIISIYLFIFGFFAPLSGIVSDKLGIKKQFYISFIVMNIALLLLFIIRKQWIFTVIIIGYFLGATFLNGALQNSLLSFRENEDIKGFVFGVVGAAESIGYAIGPIYAAFLYNIDKEFLFLGMLIISVIVFIIFLILKNKALEEK
ncbi:MAG: MFS transporter [Clostridium sp.]|uniref:MFS transporter n=1 Tax=Clostridium sp. TaxID=1506 RepID=UPI003EE6A1B6